MQIPLAYLHSTRENILCGYLDAVLVVALEEGSGYYSAWFGRRGETGGHAQRGRARAGGAHTVLL
jgi:hypothetical protein